MMRFMKMIKKRKITFVLILLFFIVLTIPLFGDAADPIVPCGKTTDKASNNNWCTLCHLVVGIKNIIDYGTGILLFVATLAIVVGAILYIISAGNEQTMEKAKNIMKKTVWGVVIILSAWAIINISMLKLGGIDNDNNDIPDFGFSITSWNTFSCY